MLKTLCMQNKLLNSYKRCQGVKISPYFIFTPKDNLVDFAPLCLPLRRANPPTNLLLMLKASHGPKISKNLYEKVKFDTGFKKGSHQSNENKEYFTLLLVRSLRIIKMDLCTEIHLANIKESNQ